MPGPGAATGKVVFNAEDAEALGGPRRAGDPRQDRDVARGHPRHECGPGHPHLPRRHDEPRGARCPPDGQGVRCGRGRAGHRLQERRAITVKGKTISEGDFISIDGTTGEVFVGQGEDHPFGGAQGPRRQDAQARRIRGIPGLRVSS